MTTTLPLYQKIEALGGFPLHCSHRGGAEEFGPENTLYTYHKSVTEHQTGLLEIDLRVTSDGEMILLHDDTVDRTTNGTGDANTFTLEEIKKLDAAHGYPGLEGTGITIPTFREFLDEFAPCKNLMFMLDIKDIESVPKALQLVQEYGIEDRILLGAIPTDCSELCQKMKPKHVPIVTDLTSTLAILGAYWLGALHWYTFEHQVFGFILSEYTDMFWSKGLVDAIHEAGCKVLVCGDHLNIEEFQQQCIDYGVDFILSDRPDVLQKTMKGLREIAL